MRYQPGRYGATLLPVFSLSLSLSLHGICTCLHGYMCASTHAHVCICMWVSSLPFSPTLVSEMESLTEYRNHWAGMAGQGVPWIRSPLPLGAGITDTYLCTQPLWVLEAGIHVLTLVWQVLYPWNHLVCVSMHVTAPWVVLCFSSTPEVLDSKLLNSRTWCCG